MPGLLTTVPHDFAALTPERLAWWEERATVLDRRAHGKLAFVRAVVRAARTADTVLLDGSVGRDELYNDLFAAAALKRRKRIVISDATWKDEGLPDRLGLKLVDSPQTTFCVLSSDEVELFPRTWGVDASRVVFTPFCYTLTDEELDAPTRDDGGVFAGGDSMRDYGPLLEIESRFPVTIASRTLGRPVEHERFNELLRAARVVVVPLEPGTVRSAGQQTYLNAMAIGKLVVVTEAPGVRDYVEDRVNGLVVPPRDARALADALAWAIEDGPEQDAVRARAREHARARFSPDVYFARLYDVANS